MDLKKIGMQNKIKIIENYARSKPAKIFAHGFDHTDRVRNWAIKIAVAENYPKPELAEVAALLHDIGRSIGKGDHGKIGAEMAKVFLSERGLFKSDEIEEICNAVRFHNKNREGKGELLDILRDADILDLLGAIGVLRAGMSEHKLMMFDPENVKGETWGFSNKDFDKRFDSGVGIGKTISDNLNFQISCYDNLKTNYAKKIAGSMVKMIQDFILQVEKEAGRYGIQN